MKTFLKVTCFLCCFAVLNCPTNVFAQAIDEGKKTDEDHAFWEFGAEESLDAFSEENSLQEVETDLGADLQQNTNKEEKKAEVKLSENMEDVSVKKDEEKNTTWLSALSNVSPKKKEEIKETFLKTTKGEPQAKQKSNAAVFDVAGVMLRMTPVQVNAAMEKRGFVLVSEDFEIPNFIKWRYEEKCRASGVIGYERLSVCVVENAKKEKHYYLQKAKYAKYNTSEELGVNYTSNFTGNKAYKVFYKTMATNVTGNSEKSRYLRAIKFEEFWKGINRKYGRPDNEEQIKWGLGGQSPYLQAARSGGQLLLEDPSLLELDYTRMSREDSSFVNTTTYSF